MKRVIALALCLLMVLSLMSCGGQDSPAEETEKTVQQTIRTEPQVVETTEPEPEEPGLQVGDSIFLGTYEQDNDLENGPEPIEWTILDEDENGYMLISTYVLDFAYYHSSDDVTLWPDSDIRAWLNGEFYSENFTDAERAKIRLTVNTETTEVSRGQHFFQCAPTEDYIYLLSVAEVYQYYPDPDEHITQNMDRLTVATSYAYDRVVNHMGVKNVDSCVNTRTEALGWLVPGTSAWLLRSVIEPNPEFFSADCWVSVVEINTEVGGGYRPLALPFGIRPAMWISK